MHTAVHCLSTTSEMRRRRGAAGPAPDVAYAADVTPGALKFKLLRVFVQWLRARAGRCAQRQ